MSLFPIIQPREAALSGEPPLCREVAWDFARNLPVWQGGRPVVVTGAEAVLAWACKALQVVRRRHGIYTWNYGNECDGLIGTAFTEDLKRAEAARYVRECLLVNRYIEGVRNIAVGFSGDRLSISCVIETIYGEVRLNV